MKVFRFILKSVRVLLFLLGALCLFGGASASSPVPVVLGILILIVALKLSYNPQSEELRNKMLDDTSFLKSMILKILALISSLMV